jgi:membrane-bound lytic murein transglycosylase A
VLTLAGCELLPERSGPAPVETRRTAPSQATTPTANPAATPRDATPPPPGSVERLRARWVPAAFGELPGWGGDRLGDFFAALRAGCATPSAGWAALCTQARTFNPADDVAARRWLEDRLKVYRVESLEGEAAGLITGYYEPLVAASRRATDARRVPLYTPPADLATRKPWYTRQQADTLPEAQAALKGRELAWLDDPLDALVLQIQGSGRLRITEADGAERLVRVAYAGHNEQPYKSIGRWLIDQGELKAGEASWPAIKDWARRNPKRLNEMLWQNPRLVFFREEPLPDPAVGPKGAQGVPLTPGRSVAVDPQSIPYGTPVWLDTTEPLSARPLQRLVMAQDTGSAITGAVRADYFWGWGAEAETQAGRMKQPLRAWVLWPRG